MLSALAATTTSSKSSSSSGGGGSSKYIYYVLAFVVLTTLSVLTNGLKDKLELNGNNDQEMINKYLLGEGGSALDSLGGALKPKLWIHTTYEKNARRWESFQSRSNTDLNQPYINLTVESVINHCAADFHVCLIDDESFCALLPDWKLAKHQMASVADPLLKAQLRQEGLLQLLYVHGGIVVPNSFVAFSNLLQLHDQMLQLDKPFMVELPNTRTTNPCSSAHPTPPFTPSALFMGAPRGKNETVLQMIDFCKKTQEHHALDFWGAWNNWCRFKVYDEGAITLIDGKRVGAKTLKGAPVVLEQLFQESFIPFANDSSFLGIYIPADEILARTKYQWFAVLSKEEIFSCNSIIAKYIVASLVETNREYVVINAAGAEKKER